MRTLYQCEICKATYDTLKEALECERSTEKPIVRYKIGEIVRVYGRFGWYDGDKKWVINPNGHKGKIAFYYVITAIDNKPREPHRLRYHLYTKAMTGKQGYRHGYTTNWGHTKLRVLRKPPLEIIKDSKDLIGLKSDFLI